MRDGGGSTSIDYAIKIAMLGIYAVAMHVVLYEQSAAYRRVVTGQLAQWREREVRARRTILRGKLAEDVASAMEGPPDE